MSKIENYPQGHYQETDFYTSQEAPTDDLGLLSIREGLSEKHIEQLVTFANTDSAIAEQTSDPKRFKDHEAYNKWLEKERSIYSLTDNEGNLLGIVWFGRSSFPDVKLRQEFTNLDPSTYRVTFALRVFDQARGKNIAKKLTAAAITAYLSSAEYKATGGGIWLETSENNVAAVKTYHPLFTQVSDADDKGRIVMVLDPLE